VIGNSSENLKIFSTLSFRRILKETCETLTVGGETLDHPRKRYTCDNYANENYLSQLEFFDKNKTQYRTYESTRMERSSRNFFWCKNYQLWRSS